MNAFDHIQWVVQRNLTGEDVLLDIRNACSRIGVDFIETTIIPFSDDLPDFPREKQSIFYGSTTFTGLLYRNEMLKKGVFFDEAAFSIENYLSRWGTHMLNYGAFVTTFHELTQMNFDPEKILFIRPDNDDKSFNGGTKTFSEINEWHQRLQEMETGILTPETKIIVAEPYNIQYEWRLWIVKGKVVAASRYREYFKLSKERGCPQDAIRFAEARCAEYMPHDIFVMDIGLCGDTYYIIECGCMNGAGFYNADIVAIVKNVTACFSDM